MDIDMLIGKFARMGARAKVGSHRLDRWGRLFSPAFRLDIGQDRKGEFFDVTLNPVWIDRVNVTDLRPRMRHLLLQVDHRNTDEGRQKFLCGHDERHWFVAGVPESAHAANVVTAIEALKPVSVRLSQSRSRLNQREGLRRRNRAFVRQGEWFFIPRSDVTFDAAIILRYEPLSRGAGSKPHVVDELVRSGGESVYVNREFPTGLTEREYRDWCSRHRDRARRVRFQIMRRNAGVFVRGKVRHPDHKAIVLNGWHEVAMNTENQSRAMRHVAFLD